MTTWVLIWGIWNLGGGSAEFSSQQTCEAALAAWKHEARNHTMRAVCVQK